MGIEICEEDLINQYKLLVKEGNEKLKNELPKVIKNKLKVKAICKWWI